MTPFPLMTENGALVIIDQTKLPGEVVILSLTDQKEIWEAIYLLKVRGAPGYWRSCRYRCLSGSHGIRGQ